MNEQIGNYPQSSSNKQMKHWHIGNISLKKTAIAHALQPKNATTARVERHIFSECSTVVGPVVSPDPYECSIVFSEQRLMKGRTLGESTVTSAHLLPYFEPLRGADGMSLLEVASVGVTDLVAFGLSLQPVRI